jgi:hypothetical protein
MTTISEENKYWADQVDELHHNALKNIKDVAAKWQAAIVAILGAFATVAFVWGPEKLEKFPLAPGFWRGLSLFLIVLGGILGIVAAFLLALAAIGIPREYSTMTGPALEEWTQSRAKDAASELWFGMLAAGGAGLLVLTVSVWLLVAAATKAPAPTSLAAIVSDESGVMCGNLVVEDGSVSLEVSGERTPVSAGATVTVVTACPETAG